MKIALSLYLPSDQTMWISIVLTYVVALIATNNCNAHSQPYYTRQYEIEQPNSATVWLGSNLYTITKSVQFLSVNSTTGKSCKLRVNPLDENIQGRLQATGMEVDKKLLVWGIRKTQGTKRYHTLLIVDPNQCTYIPVNLPVETVRNDSPISPAHIIVHYWRNRNFDVFYRQGWDCSPCSFSYNGKSDSYLNKLKDNRYGQPASKFWIGYYYGVNKFFYTFNFNNGTSIALVTNDLWFSTIFKKMYFDHTIDAASVKMGAYQNTAICYKSADRCGVTCERLDMELQPGITLELPLHGYNCNVSDVSIDVDKIGNTFIGVLTDSRLLFYVYDVVGELAADLDFGEVKEEYTHREVEGIPMGDEFCLKALVYSDNAARHTRHVFKCVDVTKFIENIEW